MLILSTYRPKPLLAKSVKSGNLNLTSEGKKQVLVYMLDIENKLIDEQGVFLLDSRRKVQAMKKDILVDAVYQVSCNVFWINLLHQVHDISVLHLATWTILSTEIFSGLLAACTKISSLQTRRAKSKSQQKVKQNAPYMYVGNSHVKFVDCFPFFL
ncbi:hypothetical protein CEXT_791101 [Caerostris extrusa]|uniref:Uncharacterized protein n=1 Tax=Caerostris extrusa TaxID=172846 RepID=A0AAV4S6H1_CAEEX|nr:hypothetical protein CEXT_791101 [Caerostris extrusa]